MTSETFQLTGEAELPETRRSGRGYFVPALLVLLAGSAFLNIFAQPVGPPPGWGNDFEIAMAEAKEAKKPVVVVFYADG